ncbi:AAA family ATPase [Magnetospirillum aberrantis]|uniref:AAA family ATPase n=1 Tax=Magnetospirillum aberrantis SpK TaxID=908842 RepID=A0A7C9QVV3_9PROT|nr:AAA family ATPase [Magnetospirillum aberrantis]NFV81880.1 AAA family ATPase [Magnetospirillum aberrantis SpK]
MKGKSLSAPFLKQIALQRDKADTTAFPFNRLTFLRDGNFVLDLASSVTILVGENGSGKSTLVEAIAAAAGFPMLGGSQDHQPESLPAENALTHALRLSWLPKVSNGFFFRAESFFSLASYIDAVADLDNYGGRRMHHQSHGESFLALFQSRLGTSGRAIYVLDEPEVALSPTRQLAFLRILRHWQLSGQVQAIIATHSPILMALPGTQLLSLDGDAIHPVRLEETEHYRVTRTFLSDPARALERLFADESSIPPPTPAA